MKELTEFFEESGIYLKKLKKESYEANMNRFIEVYGPATDELLRSATEGAETSGAPESVAADFSRKVFDKHAKKGKIPSILMMDLNFCMVYYVFPYLLKNKDKGGEACAEVLKDKWNETMGSNISYTTYEELYAGFKKKIFGMF